MAVDLDLAGVRAVGAVQQAHEFGAARAEQAGDADHLALVDVDVGRLEHAATADAGGPQHRGAGAVDLAGGHRRDGGELVELTADHLGDEGLAGEVCGDVFADELAVAQDRDAVGDLVDLIEEVTDEEDRHPAVAEVAHDAEELLDLAAVKARGRLVEDEHLGVEHHGAADGDELLDRDGVAREGGARVDVQAEVVEVTCGLAVRGLPVDAAGLARLVPEHDVLADREVRAQVDLLVHGGDPGVLGIGGVREHARLAGDDDRPAVDRVHAGEGLDESGLAGAVLAHERVDLAAAKAEVDAVEGEHAGEADRDAGHLDDRGDFGVRRHGGRRCLSSSIVGTYAGGPMDRPPGGGATTLLQDDRVGDQYRRESMTSAACSGVKDWSST